jgi:hypothetical protein
LPEEQTPAEDVTNSFPEPDKLGCIPPKILNFYFKSILYNKLDCALYLYELIGTIDALYLSFWIILDYPF